jgi:hypothetical protein
MPAHLWIEPDTLRRLSPVLAHRVDPRIDREDRYRRVTGRPYEIGKTAAHDAQRKIADRCGLWGRRA